jgi:hypothetical protein
MAGTVAQVAMHPRNMEFNIPNTIKKRKRQSYAIGCIDRLGIHYFLFPQIYVWHLIN